MELYIISALVFALAVLGLSIGVIVSGKQVQGHCGGSAHVEEQCVRDNQGNKIQSCPTCDCDAL